jgi:hypothetical protein
VVGKEVEKPRKLKVKKKNNFNPESIVLCQTNMVGVVGYRFLWFALPSGCDIAYANARYYGLSGYGFSQLLAFVEGRTFTHVAHFISFISVSPFPEILLKLLSENKTFA